ncbi:hypothetical protein [Sebaldella termitidis]|uniref:hypothetical protein n=1 Tax=Sebaldella termitidis TaxID=826 RepID=UPI003EBBCE3C
MKKNTIVIIVLSIIIVILLNHIVISGVSKSSSTEFLKLPILNSIIIALVSIISMVITNYFNLKRMKLETKEKIIIENFSIRRETNSKLFTELLKCKKYFELFISSGNEFKKSENYKNFAPLESYTNLYSKYDEFIVTLHPSTIKLMDELLSKISMGLNIPFIIQNDIENPELDPIITESFIESSCISLIEEIDKIMENIKEVNGMSTIDNL